MHPFPAIGASRQPPPPAARPDAPWQLQSSLLYLLPRAAALAASVGAASRQDSGIPRYLSGMTTASAEAVTTMVIASCCC